MADYHNLEIEIDKCCCGQPEIRVLRSSFDRPRAKFELTEAKRQELETKVDEFSQLLLKHSERNSSRRRVLAEEIGLALYELLFPPTIRRCFERSYDALRGGDGLRIRLSFGQDYDRFLGGLPWELICLPEKVQFIATQPRTSVARYLDLSERIRPLQVDAPLKTLVVMASPDPKTSKYYRYRSLDLAGHRQIMEQVDSEVPNVEVRFLRDQTESSHATLSNLRRELLDAKEAGTPYHSLHIFCHGGFDGHDEGALFLENEEGGEQVVTARQLARNLTEEVRLVVLLSCSTGKVPTPRRGVEHPFAGVASALVAQGIPAVVAMQFTVSVGGVQAFAGPFYRAIGSDSPIDDAVSEGRLAMEAEGEMGDEEWPTPVLFLRSFDARVINLNLAELPSRSVAVFNTRDLGKDRLKHIHYKVDLSDQFEDRAIKQASDWNGLILPKLRSTLLDEVPANAPIQIEFAAPLSVAFTAGFLLPVKERRRISVRQRDELWLFDGVPPLGSLDWLDEEQSDEAVAKHFPKLRKTSSPTQDVALIVGLSRNVLPAVAEYLTSGADGLPEIGKVVFAGLPNDGHFVIRDGAHAHALASSLANRLDGYCRPLASPTVHVFLAGPAGFAFALGQVFRVIPTTQLYEFDMEKKRSKTYTPSIRLESPRMGDSA